jgi:hypothetical protein
MLMSGLVSQTILTMKMPKSGLNSGDEKNRQFAVQRLTS